MPFPSTVVFVHGWSVRNTSTYGGLPERLRSEAAARGAALDVRHVWLSKYVSFRDEVRVADLARAFEAAVRKELGASLDAGARFAAITHSTGGPVVREWWQRFYLEGGAPCPMSHLVMLAPANFGSALAQLGKSRLNRVKNWFQGVDPGQGVLDWLELGSPESWELNRAWIGAGADAVERSGVFPFVLAGQTIDRKLYDHIVSYTGEAGSDGVVRVAAANLNATYVRLEQEPWTLAGGKPAAPRLVTAERVAAPRTAFKVVPGRAHSGDRIGIIRSVEDDGEPHPTVEAVLRCLEVETAAQYEALRGAFEAETALTQEDERVEVATGIVVRGTVYYTDRYSMVIFRLRDDRGGAITEFDLKLTAAPPSNRPLNATPDRLPQGFFQDRQCNKRAPNTLTYFVDADAMLGAPAVERDGKVLRSALPGAAKLGFQVEPHLVSGLVHFLPAELEAAAAMLREVVKPNQTTLVDIVLRRVVREGAFRLVPLAERRDADFSKESPGDPIPG